MKELYVLCQDDVKRWIIEAMQEYFHNEIAQKRVVDENESNLISRKEIAKALHISLVTLTDWMKRGLPYHKQRGKVYFIKSEVLEYILKNNPSRARTLSIPLNTNETNHLS